MPELRKISIDDASQITFLSNQLGYQINLQDSEAQIQNLVSHPDHCAFVFAEDEKIIGWIHAFKTLRIESKPFIEIGGLVVDENYRGKGIGKKLVEQIKEWSSKNNINTIRVRCNTKRTEAHLFYHKIGFQENKTQKIFQIAI